jgi:hypothetical protein
VTGGTRAGQMAPGTATSGEGADATGRRRRPRVAKGRRPVYLDSPDAERLLSMVLVLASEVSVLHAELDDLREALAARGLTGEDELAAFVPDERARERRAARRRGLIERMLRIVLEDLDVAANTARDGPGKTE